MRRKNDTEDWRRLEEQWEIVKKSRKNRKEDEVLESEKWKNDEKKERKIGEKDINKILKGRN